MPVISVCSTKGGVGKTTLVICLAGDQTSVKVVPGATEKTIQDMIAAEAESRDIVLVDLEGAASQTVTWAISDSDLVLMPTRTSGMDLQELYRTYAVVQRIERALKRKINARAVFSQIPPLANRVTAHARSMVLEEGIAALSTEIIARPNGYGGIHFNGVTPAHPAGDDKAKAEIKAAVSELAEILATEAK